jgi:prevent-host-death family protein
LRFSIAEAKDKLSSIVHAVEGGASAELTRRGELVAVIVSASAYRKLTARGGLWEAIEAWRERYRVDELDIDPAVFDVRDRSPGRDVRW